MLCGLVCPATAVGSIVRALLCGVLVWAVLCGSIVRTVLEPSFEAGALLLAMGYVAAGLASRGRCCPAAVGVDAAGAVEGATFGRLRAVPDVMEILPLLLATVSLVTTGVVEPFRFVRFAAATSGESSATTAPARRRIATVVLSMVTIIADLNARFLEIAERVCLA